jgi:predicted outer membrane repeat protein
LLSAVAGGAIAAQSILQLPAIKRPS